MGSAEGTLKVAARRTGLSVDEYTANVMRGLKWCIGCKAWHDRREFGADRSRYDGLAAKCRSARNTAAKVAYRRITRPRRRPGPPRGVYGVKPRDGDKRQAIGRINYLIRRGDLPRPNDLPCTDCGHIHVTGSQRHEYDHFMGYTAEHHETVEAVCRSCHGKRERARRNG